MVVNIEEAIKMDINKTKFRKLSINKQIIDFLFENRKAYTAKEIAVAIKHYGTLSPNLVYLTSKNMIVHKNIFYYYNFDNKNMKED